jgi:hypothetical protein
MAQIYVHSHSYQHFEELSLSSSQFYTHLTKLVSTYNFPKVDCEVVVMDEVNFFGASREYLRIKKNNLKFYVCAAPFGRSFFVSWWLGETENDIVLTLRRIPILKWFVPVGKTYYQIDTELMFIKSIDAIVKGMIDKLIVERVLRYVPTVKE